MIQIFKSIADRFKPAKPIRVEYSDFEINCGYAIFCKGKKLIRGSKLKHTTMLAFYPNKDKMMFEEVSRTIPGAQEETVAHLPFNRDYIEDPIECWKATKALLELGFVVTPYPLLIPNQMSYAVITHDGIVFANTPERSVLIVCSAMKIKVE